MCARYNKPVMIHISDSIGRFLPIGPENERYEAGLWRSNTEGNYYQNGHVAPEVIDRARENMHRKHPRTRFVNAHMAMLYYDMDKVAEIFARDFSDVYKSRPPDARSSRSILSPDRTMGSVIRLFTTSPAYTDEHNEWIRNLPQSTRQLN